MPSKQFPKDPQWRFNVPTTSDVLHTMRRTIPRLELAVEEKVGAMCRYICGDEETAQFMSLMLRSLGFKSSVIMPLWLRPKTPQIAQGSMAEWQRLSKEEKARTPRPGRAHVHGSPVRVYMVGFEYSAAELAEFPMPEPQHGVLIAMAKPGQIYKASSLARPTWDRIEV